MSSNPYDQIPYHCQPIEWAAPERLALCSLLHGGPAPDLQQYRVLELGCGDGANLLPLAYYRPQAEFIGIDGAITHIETALSRLKQLDPCNLQYHHCDFQQAESRLDGKFDFIIVHGVFSWVPDAVRDGLFELCKNRLKDDGLLYLNYNTKPGWNIRGMIREYLLAHTRAQPSLAEKIQQARAAAGKMARSLSEESHPYSKLLANEFQFVCDNHDSYLAHEFLAEHNQAYWRSEFMNLAKHFGLHYVADADYNYSSGRTSPTLYKQIETQDLIGTNLNDTVDLVSYRQLHTPLFSKTPVGIPRPDPEVLINLQIASCLQPIGPHKPHWYQHPNGYQVEAKDKSLAYALDHVLDIWPKSAPLDTILEHPHQFLDDLILLHDNGLLELRLSGSPSPQEAFEFNPLNRLEQQWGNYYTTANHQRVQLQAHHSSVEPA